MPITFGCASCGKLMRVADVLAGKSVRCPHCQAVVVAPDDIPVAPVVPPPAAPPPPAPLEVPPEPSRESPDPVWETATRTKAGAKKLARYNNWESFGAACRSVSVGIWVEFAAYMFVLMVVIYAGVMSDSRRDSVGPAVAAQVLIALFLIALTVGSVFSAVGRCQMMDLPGGTGVGGLVIAAGVLSVLRVLVMLGAAAMVFSTLENPRRAGSDGLGLVFLAVMLGWLTDMAVLPALGVIGGMVQGPRLRKAVGAFTLYTLLVFIAWFVTLVVVSVMNDESPYGRFVPSAASATARRESSGVDDPTTAIIALGVFFGLYVVYAILHQAVYQAGRAASRRPTDEED